MAPMDVYDVIALTIHANGDKMSHRTTIQKLVYFHTLKLKNLEMDSYKHHFYGPFSSEVASALEEMAAFSYLDEKMLSGFYESYHYSLTDSGKKYVEKTMTNFQHAYDSIKKTVDICKDDCNLKPSTLSYAAKSYYILSSAEKGMPGKYSASDIQETGKNFDWDISEEDISAGIKLLKRLDLVTAS